MYEGKETEQEVSSNHTLTNTSSSLSGRVEYRPLEDAPVIQKHVAILFKAFLEDLSSRGSRRTIQSNHAHLIRGLRGDPGGVVLPTTTRSQ